MKNRPFCSLSDFPRAFSNLDLDYILSISSANSDFGVLKPPMTGVNGFNAEDEILSRQKTPYFLLESEV